MVYNNNDGDTNNNNKLHCQTDYFIMLMKQSVWHDLAEEA